MFAKNFQLNWAIAQKFAILIGYSYLKKAFKLWVESANTFIVSRNVVYAERSEIDIQNENSSVDLSSSLEDTAYTNPSREYHHSSNSCPSNCINDTPCKEGAAELTMQ